MILVLDISTSLEFWRKVYPANRVPSGACDLPGDDIVHAKKDAWRLLPESLKEPCLSEYGGKLHVMAFDRRSRRPGNTLMVHSWAGPVPAGSFFSLSPSVFVAAPEFIFFVASSCLSRNSLIALGDELCGLYSFDRRSRRGFQTRAVPLSNVEKLRRLTLANDAHIGSKRMSEALAHVVERSASPMETYTEMCLCLPCRWGGYGISRPLMNHEVNLRSNLAHLAQREKCYPDMYWSDADLDVEYHGEYDHSKMESFSSDRARVLALKEMGIKVMELAYGQVHDMHSFDLVARRIAKLLGHRVRDLGPRALDARVQLREELDNWNKSYGKVR